MKFILLLIITLLVTCAAFGQSGRVKKKKNDPEKPKKPKTSTYLPTQKVKPTPTPSSVGNRPRISPPPPPLKGDSDEITIESNFVPIPVSVIDNATGKALTSLGLKDFELSVDGRRAEITEIFRSETPVRLAFLFDNSSSVTSAREFEVKAAIKFFRSVVRPEKDLAALFSVAGSTELKQPLTKSVKSLIRSIKSFPPPEGATALNDGIVEASTYLNDYSGRRVIVIVSDGQDTLSDISFDQMVEYVQKNNCQVYIVHTNEFENFIRTGSRRGSANLRALGAERRMRSLAQQTGGAVLFSD